MNSRKNTIVKEAVLEGSSTLHRQLPFSKPCLSKAYLIVFALIVAAGITTSIFRFSANGNLSVLQQRLLGEVHLSTGTFSARSEADLNHLSWDNGLEMLATLDKVNTNIQALENADNMHSAKLIEVRANLRDSVSRVHELLLDRKALLQSAHALKTSELYSPVYQEYLADTMKKVSDYKASLTTAEKLVENEPLRQN